MKNRWVILAAGILMQTILGGIYAWSVFVPNLIKTYSLTRGQCGSIFGFCIGVFTIVMILGGRLLIKKGPRFTALIGAILFMLGYVIASKSGGAYSILFLGIGLVSGAGIGLGYVCPLTVGMQWFPKRKGLITGVAVAGFGGGAVVLSSVASHFLNQGMDVLVFFKYLGLVLGALLILAALLLDVPEKAKENKKVESCKPYLSSKAFLLCVFSIFVATFSGLLVIGNLTPIAMGNGFVASIAVLSVSIFAIGNAVGRIMWGFFFDKLLFKAIPLSLGFFALALLMLAMAKMPVIFLVAAALLGFGFGGCFVIYASALSRKFGTDLFPKLYPVCFLGYGLAGIIGPGIGGSLADKTGSYDMALYISIAMVLFATLVSVCFLRVFKSE